MRIVLDTNVLVSGLLQALGPSGQLVRMVAAGRLTLCFDARILTEYRDVLLRPKFSFDPERIRSLLEEIRAEGVPVVGGPLGDRLPDPDDEPFLEVALAADAEYLVTGNQKHFPQEVCGGVEVVSPRDLVDRLRG